VPEQRFDVVIIPILDPLIDKRFGLRVIHRAMVAQVERRSPTRATGIEQIYQSTSTKLRSSARLGAYAIAPRANPSTRS
jgi:hypothetical protein